MARAVRRRGRRAKDGRLGARERGYTWRWQKAAAAFLIKHPICANAGKHPKCQITAEHVDHIEPHKGSAKLMWDKKNWQPLCRSCHTRKTWAERSEGATDEDGNPLDPEHPWNREEE